MKILFYNHTGRVSGAERMLLMIVARVDRRRFNSVLICPAEGPLHSMAASLGVPVQNVPGLEARFTWRVDRLLTYLGSFFFVIRELRRRVVNLRPDLIHANSIRAGLVATAATLGLGTTVVWHLHDLLPHHSLSTGIRVFSFLSPRTRMLAVSRAVAENFRGSIAGLADRITIVLNAIDLKSFEPDQVAAQHLRQELNIGEHHPVIGIVGQLTPRKGQLELIRAFANVLSERPNAILLLVGAPLFNRDHEYEQFLRESAKRLGLSDHVRFLGARSDVAVIMKMLDLLVINSSVEPFGLVALEAMACGTPVVAAACDGLKEIIESGVDGWLVAPGNERELVAAILDLSGRPEFCARLAQAGKKTVAVRFAADRYMSELENFYDSISLLDPTNGTAIPAIKSDETPKFVELT